MGEKGQLCVVFQCDSVFRGGRCFLAFMGRLDTYTPVIAVTAVASEAAVCRAVLSCFVNNATLRVKYLRQECIATFCECTGVVCVCVF